MVTLHSLVGLLSDIYGAPLFSQTRWTYSAVRILTDERCKFIIPFLGTLYRRCIWENILLKYHMPAAWQSASSELKIDERIRQLVQCDNIASNTEDGEAPEEKPYEPTGPHASYNLQCTISILTELPGCIAPLFQGSFEELAYCN
jgi:hypothetical protein